MERHTRARRAAALLFSILAAHTLLETARDALFLATLPPERLPWVYGLIAVTTLGVQRAARVTRKRFAGLDQLSGLLFLSAFVTFLFWLLTAWTSTWVLVALYVWPAVFAAMVMIEFWRSMSDQYTTIEAKSAYSVVGAGGAAGAITGAGLAGGMALRLDARHLLLAAALILVATGLALARRGQPSSRSGVITSDSGLLEDLRLVREHPYLRTMFGLLMVTTVLVTVADYIFKSIAARSMPPDALASYFAAVYFSLNLVGLFVQLVLVERMVRHFGISATPAVLPAALGAASLAVFAYAGLATAFVLKTVDGSLRNSLHRTATELLYVPMGADVRARVKAVVDIVGQRGGQVAGSALILLVLAGGGGDRTMSLLVAGLAVAALVGVKRLREPYLNLFRESLREEAVETRLSYPDLDVRSMSSLTAALSSEREDEVIAAVELLAEQRQVSLIPGLVLFHPSRAVALRSLDVFAAHGRTDLAWAARHLYRAHPDDGIRAAALRLLLKGSDDADALASALDDRSVEIRATAIVGLLSRDAGAAATTDAFEELTRDETAQAALVRAVAHQPSPQFHDLLIRLARSSEVHVRFEVSRAMATAPHSRFLPSLRDMLSERALRPWARLGFVRIGEDALRFLRTSLNDRTLPHEIRLHIPRSVSRFPAAVALPNLLEEFVLNTDDAIRYKILRGLGRLRAESPEVPVDSALLNRAIEGAVVDALRLVHWTIVFETAKSVASAGPSKAGPSKVGRLLLDLLEDAEHTALETLFRLLGLRHPTERFEHIFRGLGRGRSARASSVELIEHVVDPRVREAILGLTEGGTRDERLARGRYLYQGDAMTVEQALTDIVSTATGALRVTAGLRVAELKLRSARQALEMAREQEPAAFHAAIDRALRELEKART